MEFAKRTELRSSPTANRKAGIMIPLEFSNRWKAVTERPTGASLRFEPRTYMDESGLRQSPAAFILTSKGLHFYNRWFQPPGEQDDNKTKNRGKVQK